MENEVSLVIGTYQKAQAKALQIVTFNTEKLTIKWQIGVAEIDSPSFVEVYQSTIFAVSEEEAGFIYSYHYDGQQLTMLSRQSTHGAAPCYIRYDASKRALYVTNYVSGSIAVFTVNEQFEIQPCKQLIQHTGSSVNVERQEAAHAHSIEILPFATDYKIVQDLGCDTISLYFTEPDGMLTLVNTFQMPLGNGPRHVAFHKEHKLVYVLSELTSTVDVLQFDENKLTFELIQTIATLPKGFLGENTGADIHISPAEDYLFASNRGHDSITIFTIDAQGQLAWHQCMHTGGETPRNFAVISDDLLVIGNQNTDKLTMAKRDECNLFALQPVEYLVEKPVCVKVL
ncbi:lactonase family protein [Metasolibacillus sp.]|uniref:lactonase family protein n=1 Tax=Metasolibacillus sp. TaxID=2703680 RepID=UPI0025FA484A|nr:lactonase family protein [Metasolibacillus sp.]MCT6925560.1 lactonase family protein [Metasolibacillus sp.]MCT6941812.1 lactonase family protein [Metasolibacillus sp.]